MIFLKLVSIDRSPSVVSLNQCQQDFVFQYSSREHTKKEKSMDRHSKTENKTKMGNRTKQTWKTEKF